jgi:aminoglycoside phosphotransferase (APT) family kinase protein
LSFVDISRNPAELKRILVGAGLAQPGDEPLVQPLAGGVSSGILRVDLPSGTWCVKQALPKLRVAKLWLVPVDRVFAEIDWLQTAARVVPRNVPHVVAQDHEAKCFVMEFLGDEYRNWKQELLAGRIDPGVGAAVGALLGRIHAATAGDEALRQRFAHDANFHALRLEPYLVEAARVQPALAPQLTALVRRTQQTRLVLVHGDVSPKNILLGPQGPVLLDAECAWYGEPAFDVAFCLNHLLLKAAWQPQHLPPLLDTFDALVDAYLAHVTWEAPAQLEGRVASLLPALTLARVDGKSPAEYLDEAARTRVRAAAWPLVESPPLRLAEVHAHWVREFAR